MSILLEYTREAQNKNLIKLFWTVKDKDKYSGSINMIIDF